MTRSRKSRRAFANGADLADRRAFLGGLKTFAGFEVVEGAGHWAMYERADGFNAAALKLID